MNPSNTLPLNLSATILFWNPPTHRACQRGKERMQGCQAQWKGSLAWQIQGGLLHLALPAPPWCQRSGYQRALIPAQWWDSMHKTNTQRCLHHRGVNVQDTSDL
eukprot:scaffold404_cov20-Tisochrysis_lutea.AAC.2